MPDTETYKIDEWNDLEEIGDVLNPDDQLEILTGSAVIVLRVISIEPAP